MCGIVKVEREINQARHQNKMNEENEENNGWGEDYAEEMDYRRGGDEDCGKQFYVNPAGICEDAPCCGCCGMGWKINEWGAALKRAKQI